ncbi:SDR family oxidoreductase [Desulfatirhabdium butyrativorans]|uniref:SDR family oxidoreductase n=1 Tax=Desulfatirhabdium butyrativorans TaxID=340467 RepID=UPI00041814F9|nr:SDR family oxidoreductase [Desulfatirhabdium butyrativorans]
MNLLIAGANSDLAVCLAETFAAMEKPANILLASRNLERLEATAKDISIRFDVPCKALAFDALDYESLPGFYAALDPGPDWVILCFGYLGDEKKAEQDWAEAKHILDTNYAGAVRFLEIVAADLEKRKTGGIVAIGSVAGLRGRKSNYHYGAAKAALGVFLSGLRNRLHPAGVRVMTVLPGFLQTKMTQGMPLPALLTTSPNKAAALIHAAWKKQKDIAYIPGWWRWIMLVIRMIPEKVFKGLSL